MSVFLILYAAKYGTRQPYEHTPHSTEVGAVSGSTTRLPPRLRRWKAEPNAERLAFDAAWKTDGGVGIEADWIVTEADGALVCTRTRSSDGGSGS